MDAHLFRRFCEDLTPRLAGARVEKLQEPFPGFLVLTWYGGGSKRQICLRYARKEPFCFSGSSRISAGKAPSAQIMRLRKYAVGRRINACVVRFCERRLWLLLAGGEVAQAGAPAESTGQPDGASRLTWLLLDLREGASLHFLAHDEAPEEEAPAWPEPAQLAQARQNWRDWPVLTPALRRTLAFLEEPEQWALLEDLRAGGGDVFCYGPGAQESPAVQEAPAARANATDWSGASGRAVQSIRAISAWPLALEQQAALLNPDELHSGTPIVEECGADVLRMVERAGQDLVLSRLAGDRAREAALPLDRRGRKLTKLLDKLIEEEKRLRGMTELQADALALQAHLWQWPAEYRAASVLVDAGPHGPSREIRLDPRRSVREEMARFFHTARRGWRGLEHLVLRRRALEDELAAIHLARRDSLLGVGATPDEAGAAGGLSPRGAAGGGMHTALPKNVQLFISSDGFALLRGRDARGNLAVRKLAAPHDIWLHAENGPGSHVIIRRAHGGQEVPARTLDEAGALAANKSWQKDAARAGIQYAEVRHVKPMRNAPAGTVRIDRVLASREVPVDATLEEKLLPE
ncbi:NFACT RNA binding domain-containing protein [Desulfovibrio sp.]|uniref:NFACT RNA binding domain-containing protein n=1 Tax=Desulfovibrio sp. TaxID=885 RepID=UPI0025BF4678|nr:NFACT RNA binding domain-containing protein [Desulfovibrio sp.]